MSTLLTLIWSFWLSWHDLKTQSFPLWLWLIFHLILVWFFPLNSTSLLLLALGGLAEWRAIGIGSGDFLYLASLALILDWQALLWVIQIGCLLGILAFYALKRRGHALPFVPCLTVGYLVICLLGK